MSTDVKPRRERTNEEKLAIIAAFDKRDKSIREVAKEHGVTPQLIYNWKKRLQDDEGLDPRKPGRKLGMRLPPRNKALEEAKRTSPGAVLAGAPAPITATPKKSHGTTNGSADREDARSKEVQGLRIENAMLREENERLRDAIAVLSGRGPLRSAS